MGGYAITVIHGHAYALCRWARAWSDKRAQPFAGTSLDTRDATRPMRQLSTAHADRFNRDKSIQGNTLIVEIIIEIIIAVA